MPRAPTRLRVAAHVERWAVWPFSAVSGLLGAVAVGSIFERGIHAPFSPAQLTAIGLSTAILTYAALRLALRASRPRTVAWATLGTAIVFAAINCPTSVLLVSTIDGTLRAGQVVETIVLSGIFGVFFSIPLGCLWALALAGPMYVVAKLRVEPSLDGPDVAARAVGGTLAITCTFGALFARHLGVLSFVLAAIAALGAIVVLVATIRLHALARFLHRVRRGEAPGWDIVAIRELDDLHLVPHDLPSTDLEHHPDAILLRTVESPTVGAYRTGGTTRIPWARTWS